MIDETEIRAGDAVQVYNPGPLYRGTALTAPERQCGHLWIRVRWEDGTDTFSRADLLRVTSRAR